MPCALSRVDYATWESYILDRKIHLRHTHNIRNRTFGNNNTAKRIWILFAKMLKEYKPERMDSESLVATLLLLFNCPRMVVTICNRYGLTQMPIDIEISNCCWARWQSLPKVFNTIPKPFNSKSRERRTCTSQDANT